MDPKIVELLKKRLYGRVSPHTIPSAISRTKERYPFLTLNAAAEVYGSRYHVSVHKFLNEKDREALGTFAVGKTNIQTKPKLIQTQRIKTASRLPVQRIGKMEKMNEEWDVFICYKRISGEDLAEAVKKILEECHVHAFLDTKDIPAKFKGTVQWFDARDNAVLKCKFFVLILTAGFDSSAEIKKELTLARSIPDKLFTYFRHKDLSPSLKIALENEVLDISKQQQYSFGTLNDLVRTAHKILVTDAQPHTNIPAQMLPTASTASATATDAKSPVTEMGNSQIVSTIGAISNFAAFYDQVFGSRKIQKVYPKLFTTEEMTSPGKASKICRVLDTFMNDKGQFKQALQTIINLHTAYSKANIAALRDIVDGFGFKVSDDLLLIEKEKFAEKQDTKEIVQKYNKAIFDEESSTLCLT